MRYTPVDFDLRERKWFVVNGFNYHDTSRSAIISIPAGFKYDMATIPRIVWPVLAPFELGTAPPAVHDFLYRNRGRTKYRGRETVYTRRQADRLFRSMMREVGVGHIRRGVAWFFVRIIGWWHWFDIGDKIRALLSIE